MWAKDRLPMLLIDIDEREMIRMSQKGRLNCDFVNFSKNFNLFELLLKINLVFRKF